MFCQSLRVYEFRFQMNNLKPYFQLQLIEAGCDEAGRGCLAGPVFAASVVLPKDFYHPYLNDSKQVSVERREILRQYIENNAIAWGVASIDKNEIDQINIANASYKAMHLAINKLTVRPQLLLIDGNRFTPYPGVDHICIIKGDSTYAAIAAASILAKTYRDRYMLNLHKLYPQYGWDKNKGYGTLFHRRAIIEFGRSPYHRDSFHFKIV